MPVSFLNASFWVRKSITKPVAACIFFQLFLFRMAVLGARASVATARARSSQPNAHALETFLSHAS
eukprot:122105-Amphidinium_carterae.2